MLEMKKQAVCLAAAVMMLFGSACAEVSVEMLGEAPGMTVFLDDNQVDSVYRMGGQPFLGETDSEDAGICAWLDLVELPDSQDCVIPRLMLCLESYEEIQAQWVEITAGKQVYRFQHPVFHVSEYDMTFYEDYALYLVGDGRKLLKDLAETGGFAFSLEGKVKGRIGETAQTAKELNELYRKAGGDRQNLTDLEEAFPVQAEKQ